MKQWSDELKVLTDTVSCQWGFWKKSWGEHCKERMKLSSAGCNNSSFFICLEGDPMEIIKAIKALGKLEDKFGSSFLGAFEMNKFLAAVGRKNHQNRNNRDPNWFVPMCTQHNNVLWKCYMGSSFETLKRFLEREESKMTPWLWDWVLQLWWLFAEIFCSINWDLLIISHTCTVDSVSEMSKSCFFFSAEMSGNKHWLPLPEFLLAKRKSSALREVEMSVN